MMARNTRNYGGTSFDKNELLIAAGIGLALYVLYKGGIRSAAEAIGSGIVSAAGGVVTGGVDTIGQGVGLPPLADITTDKFVARYIIDHPAGGSLAASRWASAAAFGSALFMDAYTGHVPPESSAIWRAFPPGNYSPPQPPWNSGSETAADFGWPDDLSMPM